MYSAPHTRQTTPLISTSPHSPHTSFTSFPLEISQLSRDNRELEARAKALSSQVKKFQAKINEMRSLERDLAQTQEDLRLQREENDCLKRELMYNWAASCGNHSQSEVNLLRNRLKTLQSQLTALARTARRFVHLIPPTQDANLTKTREKLALYIENCLFSTVSSPKSPFESLTFESKLFDSQEMDYRTTSEPTQTDTMQPSRHLHKLKSELTDLHLKNLSLEGKLRLELDLNERIKGEKEELEHDCEELKKENWQFIRQLEWMAKEQNSIRKNAFKALEEGKNEIFEKFEGCLMEFKENFDPVEKKIGGICILIMKLNRKTRQFKETLRGYLEKKGNKLEIEGWKREIEQLKREKNTDKKEIEELNRKIIAIKQEKIAENDEIDILKIEIEQLKRGKAAAKSEIESLNLQLIAVKQEKTAESDEIDILKREKFADKEQIEALNKKIIAIKQEKTAEIREKDTKIAEIQEKYEKLATKNQEEMQILRNELKTLKKQADFDRKQLENNLKSNENAKNRVEIDIKLLENQIKQLELELKSKIEENVHLKQANSDKEVKLMTEISENKGKNAVLEGKLVEKSEENKRLRTNLTSFRLKLQKKLRNMQLKLKEIGVFRVTIPNLIQEMSKKWENVSLELTEEVQKCVSMHENTVTQLRHELKTLQEENSALGSENSFLNQETEQLRSTLYRVHPSKEALSEASAAIKALHVSLQVSSQEYSEVYEVALALQLQLTEALLKQEEYRERGEMLAEDWTVWTERVVPAKVHRTQIRRLEKENEQKAKELDQVTESLFKLVRQQEELQEVLLKKEKTLNKAEEERFRLEQLLASSRKMAVEEVESLNHEIFNLKESLNKKEFDLEKLAVIRRSLESRNSELQGKLALLQYTSSLEKEGEKRLREGYSGHVQTETSLQPREKTDSEAEMHPMGRILDSDLRSISLEEQDSGESELSRTLQEEVNQLNRLKPGEVLCKRVVWEGVTWLLVSAGRRYRWIKDGDEFPDDSVQSLLAEIEETEGELEKLRILVRRLEDIEALFEPYMSQGEELVLAVSKLLQDYEQMKRTMTAVSPEGSLQSKNCGLSQPVPVQSGETDYLPSEYARHSACNKLPYSHLKDLIGLLLRSIPIL